MRVQTVAEPEEADPSPRVIPCLAVAANLGDLSQVAPGIVDARAGRAAYEFLTTAARLALEAASTPSRPCPSINWPSIRAASAIPVTPRSSPNSAAWPNTP